MKTRRKYSREFKLDAVRLANEPEVTLKHLGDELGAAPTCSVAGDSSCGRRAKWSLSPGKGKPRDEEMAALKRELARVTRERDFLKEAAEPRATASAVRACRDSCSGSSGRHPQIVEARLTLRRKVLVIGSLVGYGTLEDFLENTPFRESRTVSIAAGLTSVPINELSPMLHNGKRALYELAEVIAEIAMDGVICAEVPGSHG